MDISILNEYERGQFKDKVHNSIYFDSTLTLEKLLEKPNLVVVLDEKSGARTLESDVIPISIISDNGTYDIEHIKGMVCIKKEDNKTKETIVLDRERMEDYLSKDLIRGIGCVNIVGKPQLVSRLAARRISDIPIKRV